MQALSFIDLLKNVAYYYCRQKTTIRADIAIDAGSVFIYILLTEPARIPPGYFFATNVA